MPDWVAGNLGTILTVGASVLVAIIGGVFGLWARTHTPKQPVPIQDIWTENRALRADLLSVEQRLDLLDGDTRRLRDGLGVLWHYVQRLRLAWGEPDMPVLTATERRTLQPLIEDLDTPGPDNPAPTT